MLLSYATVFCIFFNFYILPVSARVVITEVMYDPEESDKGKEWVEIFNDGGATVEIVGQRRFVEGGSKHYIKEAGAFKTTLEPGEAGVIVQDAAVFADLYPNNTAPLFLSKFSLRQQSGIGESLGIYNTDTKQIEFEVFYTPDDRASGSGATLHITVDNTQVAAPATPGVIAINPITVRDKPSREKEKTEEKAEEEQKEEEKMEEQEEVTEGEDEEKKEITKEQEEHIENIIQEKQRTTPGHPPPPIVSRYTPMPVTVTPLHHQSVPQIVYIEPQYTPLLTRITVVLTVIAFELLCMVICLGLLYRHYRKITAPQQDIY